MAPIDEQRKFETDSLVTGRTETETTVVPLRGRIWSTPGTAFKEIDSTTDNIRRGTDGGCLNDTANTNTFVAPVNLPNGAIVTGVIVYGSVSDESWTLTRVTLSNSATATMGTANLNTQDTSISNATIDNNTYCYVFSTSSLDMDDLIRGARIIYTF